MKELNEEKYENFKILLIEDDEDDYVLIRDLLQDVEEKHFELHWVDKYEEGLENIINCGYDACLLDYRLGVDTGIGFIEEIKRANVTIPIIILTGQGGYGVDIKAMKMGAADYLVKDQLSGSLLERVIRYSINRANAVEELKKAQSELEDRVRERTAELEAAYDSLKKKNQDLKLFAYSVIHDLKNPAISVYGLTKRLSDICDAKLSSRINKYCTNILKGSEQILHLIQDINVLISTKESRLEIEDIELHKIIEEIMEEYQDIIDTKNITLVGPITECSIKADRLSMIRCLRNLIDNALKYGGEGLSRIEMDIQETEESFIISVSDDGIGMSSEDTENIFDPFQRSITSKGTQGAGLGLAIVKEIAEKHRGDVRAQNNTGKGVTFFISISKALEL